MVCVYPNRGHVTRRPGAGLQLIKTRGRTRGPAIGPGKVTGSGNVIQRGGMAGAWDT